MKYNKIYRIKTLDLLKKVMKDNDYSYDIYFRMAVVDQYLNGNQDIWNLYDKMQKIRVNGNSEIPTNMSNHKKEFIELIDNIKNNGFDYNNPVIINNQFLLIDGAHRMACVLYFGIEEISILIPKDYASFIPNDYSKIWFEENHLEQCIDYCEKQKASIERIFKNV